MKEVKISVIGESGSGKSRLLYVIKEALKSYHINIDELKLQDHDTEEEFDIHMASKIWTILDSIDKKTHITLEEVPTNRGFSKENS